MQREKDGSSLNDFAVCTHFPFYFSAIFAEFLP